MGIEPTLEAWEAAVLPLNYTRFVLRPSMAERPDAKKQMQSIARSARRAHSRQTVFSHTGA